MNIFLQIVRGIRNFKGNMIIVKRGYIMNLLTNYYEYADNIRNLPVKELMRRQGEKTF